MVSLRDEFNRNKETETSKNERIPKTDGRSMKYRNTGNGIISTLVKLSFLTVDVCYASNLEGAAAIHSYVRLSISVAVLGGREHQIPHANVDIELNGV